MADLRGSDTVLEIGAGKGHITRQLAMVCRQVVSYEIDPALCHRLQGALLENVSLRCGDFLMARLPRGPYKVFANIPFSLTTAILRKLTMGDRMPEAAWLIVERCGALLRSVAGHDHEPGAETLV